MDVRAGVMNGDIVLVKGAVSGMKKFSLMQEGVFFGWHVSFLGWTPLRDAPPPNPPSSALTQIKMVPICSFFK